MRWRKWTGRGLSSARIIVTPYLAVAAVSAIVTFGATPLVRHFALRFGAIAHPSDRMVHDRATPSAGGLAMYLGVLAGLAVASLLPLLTDLRGSQWWWVIGAASAAATLGAIDDVKGISAPSKLVGQIFSAGILVLGGVQLLYFLFPGQGVLSLSSDLAVPLTILWVVLMMNAVNLIDGLDGLAAGMVGIAAVAFFIYMYRSPGAAFGDASGAALLASVTVGVTVGFLPWNFNPAKIFMGDSGSMLLGMLLAVSTIFGVGRNPYPPTGGDLAVLALPVFLPLLVLAIPLLDVVLAIVRRVRKGRGIGHADKEHIHHHLVEIGHSHRRAVLLMYLWSTLISGLALTVAFVDSRLIVALVALGAFLLFLGTLLPTLVRGRNGTGGGSGAAGAHSAARTGDGADPARPPADEPTHSVTAAPADPAS
jgi:UDP-GlcNAc:undecaprenyl-phosphate/decaprenyl-phosphate GlcNAc-1-phosphate transferase